MKKSTVAIIVCACLFVFGAVLAFGGWLMGGATNVYWSNGQINMTGGWNDHGNPDDRLRDSKTLEEFDRVYIGVTSEDVILIESDHFAVEYDISAQRHIKECGVKNGEFRFTFASQISFGFNLGWNLAGNSYVKLYYPKGTEFENINLGTVSGDIEANGVVSSGKLELSTTSGDMRVNSAKVKEIDAGSTSGKFLAEYLEAGEVDVTTTSGSVEISQGEFETVKLGTTSGRLTLSGCEADSVKFNSTSGDFRGSGTIRDGLRGSTVSGGVSFEGALTGKTNVSTTSGKVQLTTSAPQDEFEYSLDSVSGTRRVNGMKSDEGKGANAKHRIEASTVSGSITLEFGK